MKWTMICFWWNGGGVGFIFGRAKTSKYDSCDISEVKI